jgi:hypothetical protein
VQTSHREVHLPVLRRALRAFFGPEDQVVSLRRPLADLLVPDAMDILVWQRTEDNTTVLATAGASSRELDGALTRIELAVELTCRLAQAGVEVVARQLAELAVRPHRRALAIQRGTVLDGLRLWPFEMMPYCLLAPWNLYDASELCGTAQPVELLRVVPVFAEEATLVAVLGPRAGIDNLVRAGLVPENPHRQPVVWREQRHVNGG